MAISLSVDDCATKLRQLATVGDIDSIESFFFRINDKRIWQHAMEYELSEKLDDAPLNIACRYGHMHVVKKLLDLGDNPNVRNYFGQYPLYIACVQDRVDILLLLLEYGATMPDDEHAFIISPFYFFSAAITEVLIDYGLSMRGCLTEEAIRINNLQTFWNDSHENITYTLATNVQHHSKNIKNRSGHNTGLCAMKLLLDQGADFHVSFPKKPISAHTTGTNYADGATTIANSVHNTSSNNSNNNYYINTGEHHSIPLLPIACTCQLEWLVRLLLPRFFHVDCSNINNQYDDALISWRENQLFRMFDRQINCIKSPSIYSNTNNDNNNNYIHDGNDFNTKIDNDSKGRSLLMLTRNLGIAHILLKGCVPYSTEPAFLYSSANEVVLVSPKNNTNNRKICGVNGKSVVVSKEKKNKMKTRDDRGGNTDIPINQQCSNHRMVVDPVFDINTVDDQGWTYLMHIIYDVHYINQIIHHHNTTNNKNSSVSHYYHYLEDNQIAFSKEKAKDLLLNLLQLLQYILSEFSPDIRIRNCQGKDVMDMAYDIYTAKQRQQHQQDKKKSKKNNNTSNYTGNYMKLSFYHKNSVSSNEHINGRSVDGIVEDIFKCIYEYYHRSH